MLALRDYQRDFFQRVRERYDSGVTRQLGVLATGLGKAVLFAALREQMNFQRKDHGSRTPRGVGEPGGG